MAKTQEITQKSAEKGTTISENETKLVKNDEPHELAKFFPPSKSAMDALKKGELWGTECDKIDESHSLPCLLSTMRLKREVAKQIDLDRLRRYSQLFGKMTLDAMAERIANDMLSCDLLNFKFQYAISSFFPDMSSRMLWEKYASGSSGFALVYDKNLLSSRLESANLEFLLNLHLKGISISQLKSGRRVTLFPTASSGSQFNLTAEYKAMIPLYLSHLDKKSMCLDGVSDKFLEEVLNFRASQSGLFLPLIGTTPKGLSGDKEWRGCVYNPNMLASGENKRDILLCNIGCKKLLLGENILVDDEKALIEIAQAKRIPTFKMRHLSKNLVRAVPVKIEPPAQVTVPKKR